MGDLPINVRKLTQHVLYCFFLSVMPPKDLALFSYICLRKKPSFNDEV